MLTVLRGPELEQLYARLGQDVQDPRVRAQAALIHHAGVQHVARFLSSGQPLHHDWPGGFNRAGLLDLIAAAAW